MPTGMPSSFTLTHSHHQRKNHPQGCTLLLLWSMWTASALVLHHTSVSRGAWARALPRSSVFSHTSSDDTTTATTTNNKNNIARANHFLQDFQAAWNAVDDAPSKILEHFVHDEMTATSTPFWRDMVAFTWNICTMEGRESIGNALERIVTTGTKTTGHPSSSITWQLSSNPTPLQANAQTGGLEFWCDLTIEKVGVGKAHFRLTPQNQIHTLLTTLLELSERPFQVGPNRIRGQIHGPTPNRLYWKERLKEQNPVSSDQEEEEEDSTYALIIGGGQAGLALGARLHLMDIPYRILEAGSQPGQAWRNRYPSLHLHDPVWYNHMPYLPFPETWPLLCPRDKIADWMEFYAKALDLNVQTYSRVVHAKQQDDGTWRVEVDVTTKAQDGESKTKRATICAQHVIFAMGNASHPRIPKLPGSFGGTQFHSSKYQGGRPFANQRVVVVGSNNSGFDIAQDLWEQGAKTVTMIQRSPSLVVSSEAVLKQGLGPLYREDAPLHHEQADLVATTMPYKLLLSRWTQVTQQMREIDSDLHRGLIEAGYRMDFGPDGTGLFAKSATEGGGFYINMGCAELLTRGDVSLRYATVSHLEPDSVVIVNKDAQEEERLPVDVIIYATGYDTMDQWVTELCGEDISKAVGRTWGLGYGKGPKDPGPWEGELRNMWKPTTVEGLWFHGGNLAQSRHYSRFLALQLAARYMDMDTPVYGIPKPTASVNNS